MMVRSLRRHAWSRGADVYWDGDLVRSCGTDDNGRPEMIVIGTGAQDPDQFGAPARVIVDFVRVFSPDRGRAPDDEGSRLGTGSPSGETPTGEGDPHAL